MDSGMMLPVPATRYPGGTTPASPRLTTVVVSAGSASIGARRAHLEILTDCQLDFPFKNLEID